MGYPNDEQSPALRASGDLSNPVTNLLNTKMEAQHNNYCIILAGGVGRKLWPASSKELPKQFIDFFGTGRTLLQQTYDRFVRFIAPDHIFVSTYEGYVGLVKKQLPDLPEANILPEPVQLNTAPAAIWGTWHAILADPEACVVVSPADQLIQHEDRFEAELSKGFEFVATHEEVLAIGVKPTQPNSAYGYIQMGEPVDGGKLYRVQSFTEKPPTDYARMFIDSGEFLWNTGIFLWKGETMGDLLAKLNHRPSMPVSAVARQMVTIAEEVEYVRSSFNDTMPRQIDLCVLERCQNVVVMECDFGWADIGCWPELHAAAERDVDDNAVSGKAQVMFSGSQHCMVYLPDGMKAVVAGLDNILVALQDDMLFICPNNDPDYVRRMINEAQVNL